jgi:hypothetical protein
MLDDLPHYLYACNETTIFWQNFINWWKNVTGEIININAKVALIGYFDFTERQATLNACILLAKWHIYKCKLNEANILFFKYKIDLKFYLVTEKLIAIRQGRIRQYSESWQIIEENI